MAINCESFELKVLVSSVSHGSNRRLGIDRPAWIDEWLRGASKDNMKSATSVLKVSFDGWAGLMVWGSSRLCCGRVEDNRWLVFDWDEIIWLLMGVGGGSVLED